VAKRGKITLKTRFCRDSPQTIFLGLLTSFFNKEGKEEDFIFVLALLTLSGFVRKRGVMRAALAAVSYFSYRHKKEEGVLKNPLHSHRNRN